MADTTGSLPLIGVQDRGVVGAVLNGAWLPFDGLTFHNLLINTSCKIYVPMGRLSFTDPSNIISSKFSLLRGSTLKIVVGASNTEVSAYDFAVFSTKTTHTADGTTYTIDFTLDVPMYLTGICDAPIEGTSSDVIKSIASSCSFNEVNVDDTNDKQVWRPAFTKFCHFASKVAQEGFVNANSCMLLAIDLNGRLRYKNVAGLDWNLAYVMNYGNPNIDGLHVWSQSYFNNGGIYGDMGGIKATTLHQDVASDSYDTSYKTVDAKRISNVVNQTKDTRSAVGDNGKFIPAPISAGNTHDNSAQAAYQNRRLKALLSTGVRVITRAYTPDVQVLDPAHLEAWDFTAKSADKKNTGNYVITNKTITLQQSDMLYTECYELSRDGTSYDPQSVGA